MPPLRQNAASESSRAPRALCISIHRNEDHLQIDEKNVALVLYPAALRVLSAEGKCCTAVQRRTVPPYLAFLSSPQEGQTKNHMKYCVLCSIFQTYNRLGVLQYLLYDPQGRRHNMPAWYVKCNMRKTNRLEGLKPSRLANCSRIADFGARKNSSRV